MKSKGELKRKDQDQTGRSRSPNAQTGFPLSNKKRENPERSTAKLSAAQGREHSSSGQKNKKPSDRSRG